MIFVAVWLAYDHWTGLNTATKIIARQMARASDATLQPGTQAFLDKVDAIMKAQSPGVGAASPYAAQCADRFRL